MQSLLPSTGLWDSTTTGQYSSKNESSYNITKNRDHSSTHSQRYYWILISSSISCIMAVFLFLWILRRKLLCYRVQRNTNYEANAMEMSDEKHTGDEEAETYP